MEPGFEDAIAAYEQSVRATLALAADFSPGDWELPTDCPGWTVKDVVAHLAGVEALLLGDAAPPHELPADLPHVKHDMARFLELGVDARRSVPGPEVAAELRNVLERRLARLPGLDPEEATALPDGRTGPYRRFMVFRAFDCWTHEQDIRRAVGRPGGLDDPGADCAWTILSGGFPFVVGKRAGASPGESVVLDAGERRLAVAVGPDGRAAPVPAVEEPTVRLTMDWETYMLLAAGRCGPDAVTVDVDGDRALGGRIVAGMTVTP